MLALLLFIFNKWDLLLAVVPTWLGLTQYGLSHVNLNWKYILTLHICFHAVQYPTLLLWHSIHNIFVLCPKFNRIKAEFLHTSSEPQLYNAEINHVQALGLIQTLILIIILNALNLWKQCNWNDSFSITLTVIPMYYLAAAIPPVMQNLILSPSFLTSGTQIILLLSASPCLFP